MKVKSRVIQIILFGLSIITVLACSLVSSPAGNRPDPGAVQTEIAFGIMSTSLANQQVTLQALQAQMTMQAQANQQSAVSQLTLTYVPPLEPTQIVAPSPIPSQKAPPSPAELVLDIQASVTTFYCYQSPYELTFTVKVSDIERGMAVYYHIRDKASGVKSEGQVIDLHRRSNNTRGATIIGGGSSQQNLQFPPMMGESYFVYQIISDDGTYRSPTYSDITFFPCAQ